jgi:hypothetical protein
MKLTFVDVRIVEVLHIEFHQVVSKSSKEISKNSCRPVHKIPHKLKQMKLPLDNTDITYCSI